MIGLIVSCMLNPLQLTVDNVDTYRECLNEKAKIEYVKEWYGTVNIYFDSEKDILRALGIVFCESRGKPTAIGINTNGTKDIGLWQFNDDTWAWLKPRQINKLLNLVCSLCGESYFTDWTMVTYCDPCIERLEREIE